MQAQYYDRDGRPVSGQRWQELGRQPGYSLIGYADGTRHGQQVTVVTFWSGIAGDGPDGPPLFCTCAGIRGPDGRRTAYQRVWGWSDITAARAGHPARPGPPLRHCEQAARDGTSQVGARSLAERRAGMLPVARPRMVRCACLPVRLDSRLLRW
jgi:hypothetical protein